MTAGSTSYDSGYASILNDPRENGDNVLCLRQLFRLSLRGLSVIPILFVAQDRILFCLSTTRTWKEKLMEKKSKALVFYRHCRLNMFPSLSRCERIFFKAYNPLLFLSLVYERVHDRTSLCHFFQVSFRYFVQCATLCHFGAREDFFSFSLVS